jgi:hypothetical protein
LEKCWHSIYAAMKKEGVTWGFWVLPKH